MILYKKLLVAAVVRRADDSTALAREHILQRIVPIDKVSDIIGCFHRVVHGNFFLQLVAPGIVAVQQLIAVFKEDGLRLVEPGIGDVLDAFVLVHVQVAGGIVGIVVAGKVVVNKVAECC